MFKLLKHYRRDASCSEDGQGLVEYALILVLVAVVVIAILSLLGPAVGNIFSEIVDVLNGGAEGTVAEEANNGSFTGTIVASDSSDGFRYYDVCNFTVSADGTYQIATVTTDKGSQFYVTGGSGTGPATGFSMESRKLGGVASTGNLTAGQSYRAYPHSVVPGDFPVSYEFTITGPGTVSGSC